MSKIGQLLKPASDLEDRCMGSILSCMIGDVLGAAVEGWSCPLIKKRYPDGIKDFLSAKHMGIYHLEPRFGMYTDDTNSILALATSLVQNQCLNPKDCAESYSRFYFTEPLRGYPDSAQKVLYSIRDGGDYLKTGTIAFEKGSYANGGMMRICPIGLAFRNASDEDLYEATRLAIISSHVNPEAIEGAFLIAKAITIALKFKGDFNEKEFLKTMLSLAKTQDMIDRLKIILKEWESQQRDEILLQDPFDEFQIRSVDATALVFWCLCRYWKDPEQCMIKCIGFGGDTDTTCSILSGILGAMYGTSWIPHRWFDNLENGEYGRDYAIQLGRWLCELDLKDKDSKMKGVELKEEANQISKQEPKKAIEIYDKIIKGDYNSRLKMDAHSNKAFCFTLIQDYENALIECDNSLKIYPNNVKVLMRKMKIYEELKLDSSDITKKLDTLCPKKKEIKK